MIIVDTRRFHSGHSDRWDYAELAHGSDGLPRNFPFHTLAPGKDDPIKGFFEKDHPYLRARHLRERVHFVAFIAEEKFEEGEIPSLLYTEPNSNLFPNTEAAYCVFESFPLRRPSVKN